MSFNLLILPGIGNSDENHWQSIWESEDPRCHRIQQADWNRPQRDDWVNQLEAKVEELGENTILLAHSLSCLLIAHWAISTQQRIAGAFLVAPPDPYAAVFPNEALSFAPVPQAPFHFNSLLVASDNDPYASLDFAQRCAQAWGAEIKVIANAGHINSTSGFGAWPQGKLLLQNFVASLGMK